MLTHLDRECQPLLRFRSGDLIRLGATERCACGRGAPRFQVIGRTDEMIVVRGVNAFPSVVAAAINSCAELNGEYRIRLPHPRALTTRLPPTVRPRYGFTLNY